MQEKILYQGAESQIFLKENLVIKRRIKKGYRLKEIDEKLRKLRTRVEVRIMEKLQGKINVPKIIKVNENEKEIIMEFIPGLRLSESLDSFTLEKQLKIAEEIGKEVGKIHSQDIIHGDLTTSNMILVEENSVKIQKEAYNKPIKTQNSHNKTSGIVNDLTTNNKENFSIFFIDFGLSFSSHRIEDKAVDLHLLKQALEAKHFKTWDKLFKSVLEIYETMDKEKILKQLEKVEKRGRYK